MIDTPYTFITLKSLSSQQNLHRMHRLQCEVQLCRLRPRMCPLLHDLDGEIRVYRHMQVLAVRLR